MAALGAQQSFSRPRQLTAASLKRTHAKDGNAARRLLENTRTQLEVLLWVYHGEDIDWRSGEGKRAVNPS